MGNNACLLGTASSGSRAKSGTAPYPNTRCFYPDALVNMPVVAEHGDIYVNPSLMDMLRLELIDKYTRREAGILADSTPKTDAVTLL